MDWNWYLFSFEGRINRGKFWLSLPILLGWMLLVMWIMWLVLIGTVMQQAQSQPHGREAINVCFGINEIVSLIGRAFHQSLSARDIVSLVGNLVGMPVFLWIFLATSVKRLHDRDRSGWWIVPFFVLPGLSDTIPDWLNEWFFAFPVGLALFILSIWGFIELGFLRGTRSTNQFGPNPLGKQQARPRSPETRLRATTAWSPNSEIKLVPHLGSPPPVLHVKRGS